MRSLSALVPFMPFVLCSMVLTACSNDANKRTEVRAVPVTLKRVESGNVATAITLVGAMDSRSSVDLFPRIDGYIAKINVTPGMLVNQGQLLIEIDRVKQEAAVAAKQSSVDLAIADYEKEKGKLGSLEADRTARQSMVDFNNLEYQRYYWLEKRGVVATATVDQEDRDLKVAKSRLDSLEAEITAQKKVIERAKKRIDEARAELRAEEAELGYHIMRAPFSGVMGDVPVKVGDYVNPTTRLSRISKTKPLQVNVKVPEEEAKALKVGTLLEILDNGGAPIGHSTVFYVAPTVDIGTQSVLVKGDFPNTNNELRPDQTVQVKLILRTGKALSVPTEAISFVAGKPFVFIAQNDAGKMVARQRPVDITDIQNNTATVKSGIQPGEEMIVSGIQMLSDKTPIVAEGH